jgi:hypothetical protein
VVAQRSSWGRWWDGRRAPQGRGGGHCGGSYTGERLEAAGTSDSSAADTADAGYGRCWAASGMESGTGRGGPWAYVGRSRGRLREQHNGNWSGPGRGAWSKGVEQSGGGRRGGRSTVVRSFIATRGSGRWRRKLQAGAVAVVKLWAR